MLGLCAQMILHAILVLQLFGYRRPLFGGEAVVLVVALSVVYMFSFV